MTGKIQDLGLANLVGRERCCRTLGYPKQTIRDRAIDNSGQVSLPLSYPMVGSVLDALSLH